MRCSDLVIHDETIFWGQMKKLFERERERERDKGRKTSGWNGSTGEYFYSALLSFSVLFSLSLSLYIKIFIFYFSYIFFSHTFCFGFEQCLLFFLSFLFFSFFTTTIITGQRSCDTELETLFTEIFLFLFHTPFNSYFVSFYTLLIKFYNILFSC